jgi:hypothetical protein
LVSSTKHRGRALAVALDFLGLPQGARLEPSRSLVDVYALEQAKLPIELTFWVGPVDGRILHNTPLFSIPGVNVMSWCVDLLHGWVLGPLARHIRLCLHLFLESGVFTPISPQLSADHRKVLAMLDIRAKMMDHYRRIKRADPTWGSKHSQVRPSRTEICKTWLNLQDCFLQD